MALGEWRCRRVRLVYACLVQFLEVYCSVLLAVLLGGSVHGHVPLGGVVHKEPSEWINGDTLIQPFFSFRWQCAGTSDELGMAKHFVVGSVSSW